MKNLSDIVEKYWGFTSFKPMQEEIMIAVLNGRDTVALLPTGGGKSLCFQVPAMASEGICIVVSPLVSLMGDQVNNLQKQGIKALKITGGISFEELSDTLDNAVFGNYKFLYLSPERLQQEMVQNRIREMNVNCIAVDEAHCISQWGNDFRPAYKNITLIRELQPLAPFIALTATATPEVLLDTISQLKLENPAVFKNSFIRENLAYKVYEADDKLYNIEKLLKTNTGSAIVYVRNRSHAVETSGHLNHLGISSTFYHGGISAKEKKERLQAWRNNQISTIVATSAFGMGIDHPNVRFVIHIELPESLESYFQEAGRAGRDGEYAEAVLFYNENDKIKVKKQFVDSLPTPKDLIKLSRLLHNYFQISYGEGEFTQHNFSFTHFCKTYNLESGLTFNGLNTLDRLGIVQLSQEFGRKSILQFILSSDALLQYFEKDMTASVIGKSILRIYGGIFEVPTSVNLDLISSKTGQAVSMIIPVLEQMKADGVVEMTLRTTDATLTFLVPREDEKTINLVSKEVEVLNKKKKNQVSTVIAYIENNTVCRSVQLVLYFDESNAVKCGICSVCASQQTALTKKEAILISEKIIDLLDEREMNSREISEKLTFTETKVVKVLQLLVDAGKLKINIKNQYFLQ